MVLRTRFARARAPLLTLLTLYSNEDITDFSVKTVISTTSVTSLIMSADGQRKGDVTVIRESCPCDVWRWITISCTVKYHLISLICCLITRYVCDDWRTFKVKKKLSK